MYSSFKEFINEGTGFSEYPYKKENRATETATLTPYYKAIPSKTISIVSFPYEYAFEENLYNITGKPIDVYFVESLDPQIKQPGQVRLKNARDFMDRCPGSTVYFPTVKKGDIYVPVANSRMKEVFDRIPVTKSRNGTLGELPGFLPVRKQQNDTKPDIRQNTSNSKGPKNFVLYDIIDLDYVAAPHVENLHEVYSMWRKLKPSGVLLVTFALQHTQGRTNLENSHEQIYKELAEPYKIKNLQNTFPNNPHFKLNTQVVKQYGLFKRKIPILAQSQNVLNNVIDRLTKTRMPAPVYTNIYLGGEGHSASTIMGRIAWVK